MRDNESVVDARETEVTEITETKPADRGSALDGPRKVSEK